MKWLKDKSGEYAFIAHAGVFTFMLHHNETIETMGLDGWTARVSLSNFNDYLFGGQRFKTEESIKAAVGKWVRDAGEDLIKASKSGGK